MQRPLCWMSVSNDNSDLASLARGFDGDIDELSDNVDVRGGMASQSSRHERTSTSQSQRQQQLIGEVFSHGSARFEVLAHLSDGLVSDLLRRGLFAAEGGEDLGQRIAFEFQHHDVAWAVAVRKVRHVETAVRPVQARCNRLPFALGECRRSGRTWAGISVRE